MLRDREGEHRPMEQTNHKILTIPNLLSAFRIRLIPVIAYRPCY